MEYFHLAGKAETGLGAAIELNILLSAVGCLCFTGEVV
jgi:hypothetical protein